MSCWLGVRGACNYTISELLVGERGACSYTRTGEGGDGTSRNLPSSNHLVLAVPRESWVLAVRKGRSYTMTAQLAGREGNSCTTIALLGEIRGVGAILYNRLEERGSAT